MIAINLLLQLVIGGGALAATGKLSAGALGMALAIVGVLHSIAIAIFVGLSRKMVEKQLEKLEGAAS